MSKDTVFQIMHRLKLLLSATLCLLSLSVPSLAQRAGEQATYRVIRIIDGDTVEIDKKDNNGKYIDIRFSCVDTPETYHRYKNVPGYVNQSRWGDLATERLRQLLQQSNSIILFTGTSGSSYFRPVGEVRLQNGTSVQEVLALEGLGMIDPRFESTCSPSVQQAEEQAKQQGRGVWGDPSFTPPWDFRPD